MQQPVEMMGSTYPSAPFAAARQFMVDSQLRPTKVTEPRLLDAMRMVPRERFLPPHLGPLAYADQDVALGGGRVQMSPLAFARLAQLLLPVVGERVLVIGAGTGYGAAVLTACGAKVTTLEEDAALVEMGRAGFASLGLSVTSHSGSLRDGVAGLDFWDAILIEGKVPEIPEAIAGQLRPGRGRLVTVLARDGGTGVAIRAERPMMTGAGLAIVPAFDCATAVLPAFEFVTHFEF
jgi:protein-L-isoaspartate(D-aspartate) O-methyltransferase